MEDYYNDAEFAEMSHINEHYIRTQNDVKTLDVKILELREDPSNIKLLYDVMAIISYQADELRN